MGLKLFVMVKLQNLQQFNCVNVGKICMKRSSWVIQFHLGERASTLAIWIYYSVLFGVDTKEKRNNFVCLCVNRGNENNVPTRFANVCAIFAVKTQFQTNTFVRLILRFASIFLCFILCAFLHVYLHCILEAVQVNLQATTYKEQSEKEKQSKKWNHFLRTSDGGCCC